MLVELTFYFSYGTFSSDRFHCHSCLISSSISLLWKSRTREADVLIQPNLQPPITTVQHALAYQKKLEALEPNVDFLMTLYLHPSMTPETIREAKEAGIVGVKSYPQGVTTNSDGGVLDYASYNAVFAEMERLDMVLNLHGECPSSKNDTNKESHASTKEEPISVLNAEEAFLPILVDLHWRFPRLRIVLEHCTTSAAISTVRACGPTVAATITAHHLFLTVDDWAGDPFCYCKPVAKTPADRKALLEAVVSGDSKFFFGSDSAPHPVSAKEITLPRDEHSLLVNQGHGDAKISQTPSRKKVAAAAGIFTQPYCTQLVLDGLELAVKEGLISEESITLEILKGFLSKHGRQFYRVDDLLENRKKRSGAEELGSKDEGERETLVITSGASPRNNREQEEEGKERIQHILRSSKEKGEQIEVAIFRGGERTCRVRWEKSS